MDEALLRYIIEMINTTPVTRIGYSADREVLILSLADGREITFEADTDYDKPWMNLSATGYNDNKPKITWVAGGE